MEMIMILNEVAKQLFNLSDGGHINGKRFTQQELCEHIRRLTQDHGTSTAAMDIALPDGLWPCTISRLPQFGRGFYDYHIPDSRKISGL
jgi:hypothetical protein